uniref:Uncharacterized protein n=1 Tax=Manihot esculenta TaxID=3983 RepID=A0A199UB32_MANES
MYTTSNQQKSSICSSNPSSSQACGKRPGGLVEEILHHAQAQMYLLQKLKLILKLNK